MEEEKAAAYYDELTRKGEGAARFKQGLGYSSTVSSANHSSSSPFSLTNFIPAGASGSPEPKKHTLLDNIHNKLRKTDKVSDSSLVNRSHNSEDRNGRRSPGREAGGSSKERIRSRSIDRNGLHREEGREREKRRRSRCRDRHSSRRSRRRSSCSREDDDLGSERRRTRGRSMSPSTSSSDDGWNIDRRNSRGRSGNRSSSYRDSARAGAGTGERRRGDTSVSPTRAEGLDKSRGKAASSSKGERADICYSQLIEGYAEMTPAERVKAKMKLQLTEIAGKDKVKGMNKEWERFDFNQEAPLDAVEVEAAEDDARLLKDMARDFRLSAVEANREAEIKAAHDQAIFGVPSPSPVLAPVVPDDAKEEHGKKEMGENRLGNNLNLISEKVFAMQQVSWRDRARKLRDGSKN